MLDILELYKCGNLKYDWYLRNKWRVLHLLSHKNCIIHYTEREYKMPAKLTQEEFVSRSKKIHKNKYDYSQVNYEDGRINKVTIICKKHGKFLQIPSSHLQGRGCRKCGMEVLTKSTEWFISKASKAHNNKYDYSQTNYKNNFTRVTIICKKHGKFLQEPHHHLRGCGCQKCNVEFITKSTSQFIKDAIRVHGNRYDYSQTNYKNNHSKVIIICNKHGRFLQTPNHHYLQGKGCPKCNKVVLADGTKCDSLIEAFRYLQYKKNNVNFKYNMRYGKDLGCKRYDFYLPDSKIYEEITSFDFGNGAGINAKIKDKYLKNIEIKRMYAKSKGCAFRFIQTKLTRKQKEYVLQNTMEFKGSIRSTLFDPDCLPFLLNHRKI